MKDKRFIEEVYEIAWGCDAINKDYTHEEVLERLKDFSIKALYVEQTMEEDEEFIRSYYSWLEEEV